MANPKTKLTVLPSSEKKIQYTKAEILSIANHPTLNEKWVQKIISEDPSVIGLGDLELRDVERIQPKAGRLDLLLLDPDSDRRYEVEIQTGKIDESHIIRTLEYWDIEKRRYPQYDHCAIIIAEDITSRFLNIISLFNGHIPIIAIQMNAVKVGDRLSLIFTTVLSELTLGLPEEEESRIEVDRNYWEKKSTAKMLKLVDTMRDYLSTIVPDVALNYVKHYIGLKINDQSNLFVAFKPRKSVVNVHIKLERTEDTQKKIEDAGLDLLPYDVRFGRYRIRVTENDVTEHKDFLISLFKQAYEENR